MANEMISISIKSFFLTFVIINAITIPNLAQSVIGRIVNTEFEPVGEANLQLFIQQDVYNTISNNDGTFIFYNITSIKENKIPIGYNISENYPNPFNPKTRFNLTLPKDGKVKITVYNIIGQNVRDYQAQLMTAGINNFEIELNGSPNGTYFVNFNVDNKFSITKKILLLYGINKSTLVETPLSKYTYPDRLVNEIIIDSLIIFGEGIERTAFKQLPNISNVTLDLGDLMVKTLDIINNPPDTPSNPFPYNNSNKVAITTSLYWVCSDPDGDELSFDIYFGASNNPSIVMTNYQSKKYELGALEKNTNYSWKIVARDMMGNETNGPIWNFKTIDDRPLQPSNPIPETNSIRQPLDIRLSWYCEDPDEDSLTYELYLGTSPFPQLYKQNISESSYQLNNLLDYTVYYWKIIAEDQNGNKSIGPIWNFRTIQIPKPCPGQPIVSDLRNSINYNTILIGEQCWFKENINIGTMISSIFGQVDNGIITKYCYADDTINCTKYGGLYQWGEVMQYSITDGAQGICPTGWKVPSSADFIELVDYVDGNSNALKSIGEGTGSGAGTNTSGFSAIFAGWSRDDAWFFGPTNGTIFWSSKEYNDDGSYTDAIPLWLAYDSDDTSFRKYDKEYGFSVRCIKDDSPYEPNNPIPNSNVIISSYDIDLSWECGDPNGNPLTYDIYFGQGKEDPPLIEKEFTSNTYTIGDLFAGDVFYWKIVAKDNQGDSTTSPIWRFSTLLSDCEIPCPDVLTVFYDGKTYNTVKIGGQCWLKENLDVGSMIQGDEAISNNGVIEKYCYDNDINNCDKYGGLYRWDEIMNYSEVEGSQGICPDGWHIPTEAEYQILVDKVYNGYDLMRLGEAEDQTGIGWGRNTTGFSAMLAGYHDNSLTQGDFCCLNRYSQFWSSTISPGLIAYPYTLYLEAYDGGGRLEESKKGMGFSVRCIKD